jgi:hypothetical protein
VSRRRGRVSRPARRPEERNLLAFECRKALGDISKCFLDLHGLGLQPGDLVLQRPRFGPRFGVPVHFPGFIMAAPAPAAALTAATPVALSVAMSAAVPVALSVTTSAAMLVALSVTTCAAMPVPVAFTVTVTLAVAVAATASAPSSVTSAVAPVFATCGFVDIVM